MSSKAMIAIKDFSEKIKKGDEVKVVKFWNSYGFHELKDGWLEWNEESQKHIHDASKSLWHEFDKESLYERFRDLTEEEALVGHCEYCETEITKGDEILIYEDDEDKENIYCRSCVEDYTVTHFMIGGEVIGDDNDGWGFETA